MTDDPGSRFLFELSTSFSRSRRPIPAVLLERWRERPEVARMTALAGEEMPGIEESGAALDLAAAIETLAMEPTLRRHQELIDKGDLTEDERAELKELNVAMAHGARAAASHRLRPGAARPADKFFGRVTLLARILRCFRGQTRAEVVDRRAIFALSSHGHLRRMRPLSRKPP